MKKQERKEGYYWVNHRIFGWMIAEYCLFSKEEFYWVITGDQLKFKDENFEKIIEKKLSRK